MRRTFLLGLMVAVAATGFALDRVTIAGTWVLNTGRSDKPPERMRGTAARADRLTITVAGSDVIIEGGPRKQTLHTDGRETEREGPQGRAVTAKSKWDGDRLVTVNTVDGREAATTTYELADGGKQLIITSKITAGRRMRSRDYKRVYDRAEP